MAVPAIIFIDREPSAHVPVHQELRTYGTYIYDSCAVYSTVIYWLGGSYHSGCTAGRHDISTVSSSCMQKLCPGGCAGALYVDGLLVLLVLRAPRVGSGERTVALRRVVCDSFYGSVWTIDASMVD